METKISRSKKFHQSRNFQEVSKSSFFWWISLAGKYQMRGFPDLDSGFDINQGQFKILTLNFNFCVMCIKAPFVLY